MDSKQFKILAVIALALFVMAGIVHSAYDTWVPEKVDGEKLLPDFERYADDIAKVTVQKGEAKLTFTKEQNGTWGLLEHGAYPAIPQEVRKLLGQIATAELVEAKTRDPKRYGLLELDDPIKPGANATLVKLSDASDKLLGELVVGKQRFSAFGSDRSGSYVRRPGNPQTWLANIALQVSLDVPDWVEPIFLKLPSDNLRLVELTPADGEPVRLVVEAPEKPAAEKTADTGVAGTGTTDKDNASKGEAGTTQIARQEPARFKFAAIPEGKKLKDGIDATAMVKALETLELTDVRKAGSVKAPQDAKTMKARVETKDDMQLDITVLKIGEDERWITAKVIADGKDADAAKKIKADVEGWEFKIPSWRSRQIFKTAVEMFDTEPTEPEEKKSDEAPAAEVAPKPDETD